MPKYVCDKCKNEYVGNFCPTCGDKRTKKDEEKMTDTEIIVDMLDDAKNNVTTKVKKITKKMVVASLLLIISIGLFFIAYYYKSKEVNEYNETETYKYIVNSNYFNGYINLSGAFLISSVLVFISTKKKD